MPYDVESPLGIAAGAAAGVLQGRHQGQLEKYQIDEQRQQDMLNMLMAQQQMQDWQSQAQLRNVQANKDYQDAMNAAIIAPGQFNPYTNQTEGKYGSYGYQAHQADIGKNKAIMSEYQASANRQQQEAKKYAIANKYAALNEQLQVLYNEGRISKLHYDTIKAMVDAQTEPARIASEIARNYRVGQGALSGFKLSTAQSMMYLNQSPNGRQLLTWLGDPNVDDVTKLAGMKSWESLVGPIGSVAGYQLLASGYVSKRNITMQPDTAALLKTVTGTSHWNDIPADQRQAITDGIKSGQIKDIPSLLSQLKPHIDQDPSARAAFFVLGGQR